MDILKDFKQFNTYNQSISFEDIFILIQKYREDE